MARRTDRVVELVARMRGVYALDVRMGHDAQGWRLTNAVGSVDLSPRLRTAEMETWLEGYLAGYERGRGLYSHPSLISAGPNAATY